MNGLEIGPLVVSNDQIIAIVALATVLLVSEIFAWRRPLEAGAIRRWTVVAALTWIVAARVGFVVRHLDLFAQQPLSAVARRLRSAIGNDRGGLGHVPCNVAPTVNHQANHGFGSAWHHRLSGRRICAAQ